MDEDTKSDGLDLPRLALILLLTFAAVLAVAGACFKGMRRESPRPAEDPRLTRLTGPERLEAAIKTHPDPRIAGDLLGTEGKEGVRVEVRETEHEDGLFTVVDGHPTISIKTSVFDKAVSAEGMQYLWGVLSHEHEHYLQWRDGESAAYLKSAHPMSESDCTLSVTLEIGAYAKACRDARKYGWDNVLYQCDGYSLQTIADGKIKYDLSRMPECEEVWRFFAGEQAPKVVHAKPAPSSARGPTYLAPP